MSRSGGHAEAIGVFLASLPVAVREAFAGSFAADPHALTPARARDLATPVIARWADQGAERLAAEIVQMPAEQAAIGLPGCLAAVNARAVKRLIVPGDELVPGYACGRCGLLGLGADECTDRAAARPVPDLIDEMAHRTLDDGGQVSVLRDAPFRIAGRLCFAATRP